MSDSEDESDTYSLSDLDNSDSNTDTNSTESSYIDTTDSSSEYSDDNPELRKCLNVRLDISSCEISNEKQGLTLERGLELNQLNSEVATNKCKPIAKEYTCKLCGLTYPEQENFIKHLLSHKINDYSE